MVEPSSIKLYTPVSVMYSYKEIRCQLKYEMGAFHEKFYPFLSKDVQSLQKQWINVAQLWNHNSQEKAQWQFHTEMWFITDFVSPLPKAQTME